MFKRKRSHDDMPNAKKQFSAANRNDSSRYAKADTKYTDAAKRKMSDDNLCNAKRSRTRIPWLG